MTNRNLGLLFTLTGAEILASYVETSIPAGQAVRLRLILDVEPKAGTAITAIKLTIRGSADGVTFYDLVSRDDSAESGADLKEHSFAQASATKMQASVVLDGGFPYLQVGIKATGGAGAAGDVLKVYGMAQAA